MGQRPPYPNRKIAPDGELTQRQPNNGSHQPRRGRDAPNLLLGIQDLLDQLSLLTTFADRSDSRFIRSNCMRKPDTKLSTFEPSSYPRI